MKKITLILAGIVLAANLGAAGAAQAAVPDTTPTRVIPCGKKAARIWEERRQVTHVIDTSEFGTLEVEEFIFTSLAAENPCKEWLELSWGDADPRERRHDWSSLFLAPGKKFNWSASQINKYGADTSGGYVGYAELVDSKQVCAPKSYAFAKKVYKYNDVRSVGDCKGADPKASRTVSANCSYGPGDATLTWKMDGKKITKIAVDNECTDDEPTYAVVWWRYKYGTAALFIGWGDSTDLWKAQLDGLPLDTIDGKLHFRTGEDDDNAYTFTFTAGTNGVGCWGGDGACEWRR